MCNLMQGLTHPDCLEYVQYQLVFKLDYPVGSNHYREEICCAS